MITLKQNIEVGNFDELLTVSSEVLSCAFNEISIFSFRYGTLIEENNYLQTLPIWTKLLICTQDEKENIFSFLYIKRLLEEFFSQNDSNRNV